ALTQPPLIALYRANSLFSSNRSRAHRALHSFPTRRSSDLLVHRIDRMPQVESGDPELMNQIYSRDIVVSDPAIDLTAGSETTMRSEEHTSELQSQSKLVCRLLLEKKKSYLAIQCVRLRAVI